MSISHYAGQYVGRVYEKTRGKRPGRFRVQGATSVLLFGSTYDAVVLVRLPEESLCVKRDEPVEHTMALAHFRQWLKGAARLA
jgi:hypothetical protein